MTFLNMLKEAGKKILPVLKPVAGFVATTALSYMGQQFISEMISPPKLWVDDPVAKEVIKKISSTAILLRHKEFAPGIQFSEFMHAVIVSKLKRGGFGGPPGPTPQ